MAVSLQVFDRIDLEAGDPSQVHFQSHLSIEELCQS